MLKEHAQQDASKQVELKSTPTVRRTVVGTQEGRNNVELDADDVLSMQHEQLRDTNKRLLYSGPTEDSALEITSDDNVPAGGKGSERREVDGKLKGRSTDVTRSVHKTQENIEQRHHHPDEALMSMMLQQKQFVGLQGKLLFVVGRPCTFSVLVNGVVCGVQYQLIVLIDLGGESVVGPIKKIFTNNIEAEGWCMDSYLYQITADFLLITGAYVVKVAVFDHLLISPTIPASETLLAALNWKVQAISGEIGFSDLHQDTVVYPWRFVFLINNKPPDINIVVRQAIYIDEGSGERPAATACLLHPFQPANFAGGRNVTLKCDLFAFGYQSSGFSVRSRNHTYYSKLFAHTYTVDNPIHNTQLNNLAFDVLTEFSLNLGPVLFESQMRPIVIKSPTETSLPIVVPDIVQVTATLVDTQQQQGDQIIVLEHFEDGRVGNALTMLGVSISLAVQLHANVIVLPLPKQFTNTMTMSCASELRDFLPGLSSSLHLPIKPSGRWNGTLTAWAALQILLDDRQNSSWTMHNLTNHGGKFAMSTILNPSSRGLKFAFNPICWLPHAVRQYFASTLLPALLRPSSGDDSKQETDR